MQNRPPSDNKGQHAAAASRYASSRPKETQARDEEAQVLLKAARMMQDLYDGWDKADNGRVEQTIKYNRQIWTVFYDSAMHPNSPQAEALLPIRKNIVSLATFVFQRSLDIIADPQRDKLRVLVTINREIAAGLMYKSGD